MQRTSARGMVRVEVESMSWHAILKSVPPRACLGEKPSRTFEPCHSFITLIDTDTGFDLSAKRFPIFHSRSSGGGEREKRAVPPSVEI